MPTPPKLRVENLTKRFGGQAHRSDQEQDGGASKADVYRQAGSVVAVAGVSFEVLQGQIFVVMGLSGSGKSTLVRCVNRLIEPTSGLVYVDDEDVLAARPRRLREIRRTKIGMVFQQFALFPHMTVGENVEYGLKIQGTGRQQRHDKALHALGQVGLQEWADTAPQNLSGGMQQRVGLARCLAADPEILLMDEPFSALDPLIRRDMQTELLALQERVHKTIVFITHDLHEALVLGDRIAIMKDGRFVQVGAPQEIVGHPADPYVAAFTREVDRSRVFTLGDVMQEAPAVAPGGGLAGRALERLHACGAAAVHVVDRQGRPVGLLTASTLASASEGGPEAAMRRDFPWAQAGRRLADCFELCATGLPIAVVDEGGRLGGVVEPLRVFAELAAGERKAADAAEQR